MHFKGFYVTDGVYSFKILHPYCAKNKTYDFLSGKMGFFRRKKEKKEQGKKWGKEQKKRKIK